jgi:hypothetical protein
MRMRRLPMPIIAGMCCSAHVHAETPATAGTSEAPERDYAWHGRVGFGVNPVTSDAEELPAVHVGFGASLSGFVRLPYRISAGVGFDWERYTFDSKNYGDPPGSAARAKPVRRTTGAQLRGPEGAQRLRAPSASASESCSPSSATYRSFARRVSGIVSSRRGPCQVLKRRLCRAC